MKTKILSIFAAALLLAGMPTDKASANDADILGIVIGGAAGGFIGSNIGGGNGRLAATAAGTLIGAFIGSEMARSPYQTRRRAAVYEPAPPPRYEPRYEPRYDSRDDLREESRYESADAPRKVVVYRREVTVRRIYVDRNGRVWNKRKWKTRRFGETRRRHLAETCYKHPRRCADAF